MADSDAQPAVAAGSPVSSSVPGVPWWGGICHLPPPPDKQIVNNPSSGFDDEHQQHQQHQQQQQNQTLSGIPPPPGEYVISRSHAPVGQSVVQTAYPYAADPFFTGIITTGAYAGQGVVQPHMLGLQQARMPLPTEIMEEEPVYVNAKQYHGILRRRKSRAKAESENRVIKTRKPYLHESRHLHALRRARGCGGRFLNKKTTDSGDSNDSGASKSANNRVTNNSRNHNTSTNSSSSSSTSSNGGGLESAGLQGSNGYHHVMGYSHPHHHQHAAQEQMYHTSAFHHPMGVPDNTDGVHIVAAMQ